VSEILERVSSQFGLAGGVLDAAVAEVMLDRPRILAVVGELEAGGVSHDLADCIGGKWCLALADKNLGRLPVVPLQTAQ
jgi:hypothetical protein